MIILVLGETQIDIKRSVPGLVLLLLESRGVSNGACLIVCSADVGYFFLSFFLSFFSHSFPLQCSESLLLT